MHSFWLEHYQNLENITDAKFNLSGPRVAFWQATYYLKYQDNAPNHQRFNQITKYYTKQWKKMWTLIWYVSFGWKCALFEMVMLGTTYGLKCEFLYKMWVLVSPDLAARDFLAAVGTETTFWEQVSWPTFNQRFRHCSGIWKLKWWTQSHHFAQIGDTTVNLNIKALKPF